MIKKINGVWVLYSKDGRSILGKHGTRQEAVLQEQAILSNKRRRGK